MYVDSGERRKAIGEKKVGQVQVTCMVREKVTRSVGHEVTIARSGGVAFALAVTMASVAAAPTRHTGAGIARRAAFHERQRAERAELETARGAVLPPETQMVHVRAVDVLNGVAEKGPNYTLLKPKEKKKERRKRQREAAAAAQAQDAANAAGADGAQDVAAAQEQQHVQASVVVAQVAAERGGAAPRGGVQHSALADALEDEEDAEVGISYSTVDYTIQYKQNLKR